MTNTVFHEQKKRGSFSFPIEYHFVDRFHPRYEMPFHWHTEYEFVAVTSGNFKMVADGEEIVLSAGECAILQGGEQFTAEFPKRLFTNAWFLICKEFWIHPKFRCGYARFWIREN